MNKINYINVFALLIVGIAVGFLLSIFVINQDDSNSIKVREELTNLSISIERLEAITFLKISCESGDNKSCEKVAKIVSGNEEFSKIQVTPTGQIRTP